MVPLTLQSFSLCFSIRPYHISSISRFHHSHKSHTPHVLAFILVVKPHTSFCSLHPRVPDVVASQDLSHIYSGEGGWGEVWDARTNLWLQCPVRIGTTQALWRTALLHCRYVLTLWHHVSNDFTSHIIYKLLILFCDHRNRLLVFVIILVHVWYNVFPTKREKYWSLHAVYN